MISGKGRGPYSTIIDKTQSKRDVSEGGEVLGDRGVARRRSSLLISCFTMPWGMHEGNVKDDVIDFHNRSHPVIVGAVPSLI